MFYPNKRLKNALSKAEIARMTFQEIVLSNDVCGGCVDRKITCIVIMDQCMKGSWEPIPVRRQQDMGTIADILDEAATVQNPREFVRFRESAKEPSKSTARTKSRVISTGTVWSGDNGGPTTVHVYDEERPAPDSAPTFLIQTSD